MATLLHLIACFIIRWKKAEPRSTSLSKCTWNFWGILIYPIDRKHLLVAAFKLALSLATSLEAPPSTNILWQVVDMHVASTNNRWKNGY
jgi:hypothetical protein